MPARRSSLDPYRARRDFTRTQEPAPKPGVADGRRFVVQHHWATRDHYDFRIELDGVLKSWAVTKPPSLDPKVRRLAVRTEDHPVDYATFEGTIPKGEYGGGTVMVWDAGTWEPQQTDPLAALDAGELKVTLDGERMKGGYVLVRLKPEGKRENWLLIKERDGFAESGADLGERYQTSVLTGRSRREIEAGRPARRAKAARPSAVRRSPAMGAAMPAASSADVRRLPRFVPPMLCEPHAEAPTGPDWLHEIKYDGYRVQAAIAGTAVKLFSREGLDWTARFGRVAPALAALGLPPSLIDGEMVVFDDRGVSRFSRLVDRLDTNAPEISYVAFDLIVDDGRSIAALPLLDRKARLAALLARADGQRIRVASWIEGEGPRVFADAVKAGAEGIVSKRLDSEWRTGRGRAWWKIKADTRDDVIVVGYMPSDKRPFASLCIAFETPDGYAYAGNVGTGFTGRTLRDVHARLEPQKRSKPPPGLTFPEKPPRGAIWVEPEVRIEVAYTERTPAGHLRHPRFLGVREDRTMKIAGRRTSRAPGAKTADRPSPRKRAASPVTLPPNLAGHLRRISNPDRVVFPDAGITKGEVAAYYIAVADRMLPYLEDRPVSFVRAPEGLDGERFFQRHALPGMEQGIANRPDPEDDGGVMVIEGLDGLVTASQFGVIEIHGWGARFPDLDKVERVVFDLDPDEGLDFPIVRSAAVLVRDVLKAAALDSVPLLSGGKGVHVVVPLDSTQGWDEVGRFAEGIARGLAAAEPGRFVATVAKAARKGRIFIDYLRNKRTATAIAPWSVRARPAASVAVPVTWKELETATSAAPFTLRDAIARKDPWPRLWRDRQAIPAGALDVLKPSRR